MLENLDMFVGDFMDCVSVVVIMIDFVMNKID